MKHFKSTLALCALVLASFASDAQNADPSINILMDPAVIQVNRSGIIRVDATNTAGDPIVANSLEITVTTGINSEITRLAVGSNANWAISSLSTGTGNTVKLSNTGGGLAAYTTDNIILEVQARTVNPGSTITGNIVYIAAINPIIGATNASQGNTQTGNDNSTTSLIVSANNPLPVELRSFTGSMSNCQANLSWLVNAAKPFSTATLEQSKDGRTFTELVTLNGVSGRSNYAYSLRQQQPRAFYRLKLVDPGGEESLSNIVVLNADCMQGEATLSPNPTRAGFRVTGLVSGGSLRVYNQFGATVIHQANSADPSHVDLSALPAGLYRVSWETEGGVVTSSVTKL